MPTTLTVDIPLLRWYETEYSVNLTECRVCHRLSDQGDYCTESCRLDQQRPWQYEVGA